MKKVDLFREIGDIRDDYLKEAEEYRKAKVLKGNFGRYAVAAASLILCLGIGYAGMRQFEPKGSANDAQTAETEHKGFSDQGQSDSIIGLLPLQPAENAAADSFDDAAMVEDAEMESPAEEFSTDIDRGPEFLNEKGENAAGLDFFNANDMQLTEELTFAGGALLRIYELSDLKYLRLYDVYAIENIEEDLIAVLAEKEDPFIVDKDGRYLLFLSSNVSAEDLAEVLDRVAKDEI